MGILMRNGVAIAGGLTFDDIYPVGSIYMSVVNTNPGLLFGGTWEAWGSGRVPVGVDVNDTSFDTVEETGGSKSESYTPGGSTGDTTLTIDQVPSHSHTSTTQSTGAHTHTLTTDSQGSHSHTSTTGSYGAHTHTLTTDTKGGHTHTSTTQSTGSHSHTLTTDSKGGGGAHNHSFTSTEATISHVQPYITCYMWKRTA